MLRRIIGEQYACGLDLGSQRIKASLVRRGENQAFELLGVIETKTNGYKNNSVTDLAELSESFHHALTQLSKKAGINIKEVDLGIGGEIIQKRISRAVIPLMDRGSKIISRRDIERVDAQARMLGVNMEEVILHYEPQFYLVDEVNTALNPLGLYGRKLEVNSMLIVVNDTLLKNLSKAVNQAGYDVKNVFFSSMASASACLNQYQRRQGCAFIDIGSNLTNIFIYKDAQLKHFDSIPVAGQHVTNQISQQLNLPLDLAEDIKKSYAMAAGLDQAGQEEILIKREDGYMPIKKEVICQGIERVVEDLVEGIESSIRRSRDADQINFGIIMVGGGALLPGLPERIEQRTNFLVKLGKMNLPIKSLQNSARYASAVGLAQMGLDKLFTLSSVNNGNGSWAGHVASKVRELYQEYF